MNKFFLAFLIAFTGIFGSVYAQSTVFSATPKITNKTVPLNTVATNITLKKGLTFGGRFVAGASCVQAPSRLFTDSLNSFRRDSILSSLNKTASLSFGILAKAGYKLQVDSITCQVAANLQGVKYRMAFSVDGGSTINFIDSDFVVPVSNACSSINIPFQSAVCNYLIQHNQSFMGYLYFFNAPSKAEINVFNVSVIGCALPLNANKDCNGNDNVWLSSPPIDKYKLVYTEDFTSGTTPTKINTKNWVTRGYGGFGGLMKDTNVYLANNLLHVKYTKQDTNYIGGGIQSLNQFHYGYYETYMKAYIGAANFHQTFWLIGANNNWRKDSLPVNNSQVEIDALQMDSYISNPPFASYFKATNQFAMYNHAPVPLYADALPYVGESGSGNAAVYDTGWIKVGLEWLPDSIKLYYNDTLRQLFLIPKPWQHHAQLGVQFSGLPTPHGYSTSMTANMSCPAGAEMLVDWFKFYAPNIAQANRDFISEGGFDYDLRRQNLHRPLCWINAQSFDINGAVAKFDTIATSVDPVLFHTGLASLKHYHTKPYITATRQILNNIANGKYTLSAWVNCSGGQNVCQMRLLSGGVLSANNIVSTKGNWVFLSQDVTVQNNRAVVEFYSDALAKNSLNIDDVSLVRQADAVLPISLLDVEAKSVGNDVSLSWHVSSEKNNASYVVERSEDGSDFYQIVSIKSEKKSTYSTIDRASFQNNLVLYYRIKVVTTDGASLYSKVVRVTKKGINTNILRLYPNPDRGILNVSSPLIDSNKHYSIKISSLNGRLVLEQKHIVPIANVFSINTSQLIAGSYYLEVVSDKGDRYIEKFVKE